jgi:ABC-type uncharacterized transport system permease subunit
MSGVLTTTYFSALVSGAILAAMPLLFAGLGETLGERAGVLGIGMDAYMVMGAYVGFNAALYGHSHWLGLLCGVVGGMAMAGIVAFLSVRLGLDQIVVGIGVILLAEGLTSVLHAVQFGSSYPRLDKMQAIPIPLLDRIPVVGEGVFRQPLIFWIGIALVFGVRWLLRSTRWGLSLRAAGERPQALDSAGVSVHHTRSWAVLASGGLAGLGGAYMSVVAAGTFVPSSSPCWLGAAPAGWPAPRSSSGSAPPSRRHFSRWGSTYPKTSSSCCLSSRSWSPSSCSPAGRIYPRLWRSPIGVKNGRRWQ